MKNGQWHDQQITYIKLDGCDTLIHSSNNLLCDPDAQHQQYNRLSNTEHILNDIHIILIKPIAELEYSRSDLTAESF